MLIVVDMGDAKKGKTTDYVKRHFRSVAAVSAGRRTEEQESTWLRWCDGGGQVIPTGAEGREIERQRADQLAERLRAMGIDPDEV